jgi:hypothetical protein
MLAGPTSHSRWEHPVSIAALRHPVAKTETRRSRHGAVPKNTLIPEAHRPATTGSFPGAPDLMNASNLDRPTSPGKVCKDDESHLNGNLPQAPAPGRRSIRHPEPPGSLAAIPMRGDSSGVVTMSSRIDSFTATLSTPARKNAQSGIGFFWVPGNRRLQSGQLAAGPSAPQVTRSSKKPIACRAE